MAVNIKPRIACTTYDGNRRRIPGWLKPIFQGRRDMLKWCSKLDDMRLQLSYLAEEDFARDLDFHEVFRLMEAAKNRVLQAAPFARCDCTKPGCEKCDGEKWLSTEKYLKESIAQQRPLS